MVLHVIARYCTVLHGVAWCCMVLHGIAWYCMVLHGIAWYCMVLHGIACNHDVLNLFSDLFSDNNQNLSFFSEFIFNSHYMFRRSGPGHMLLHTVQKQKVQGRISLPLDKVKVKFAQTEVYKDPRLEKIDPL